MADINGARIDIPTGNPYPIYDITYTKSRSGNTMTYVFTIQTRLNSAYGWVHDGYAINCTMTVGGVSGSARLKTNSEFWEATQSSGTAVIGEVKSTKTISISCTSTTGGENQTVRFKVVQDGNTGGSWGEVDTSSYTVTSSAMPYTACTAPTSFTSGTQFYGNLNGGNGNVYVSWSGASGGTNNSIVGYTIQALYPGGTWYEKWSGSGTSTTLNFDGVAGSNITISLRIQTRGSAGSAYYSGWKSGSVVALGRTKCSPPTYLSLSYSGTLEVGKSCTLSWTKGSGGLNNGFAHTQLQYSCQGSEPWHDWGTSTGTSKGDSWSAPWAGKNIIYRARTVGSAGESYASDWVSTSHYRMYPTSPSGLSIQFSSGGSLFSAYDSYVANTINIIQLGSSGATGLLVQPSGGSGFDYYRVYYAMWSPNRNPFTQSPDLVNWSRQGGNVTSSGYISTWNTTYKPGSWIRYRVETFKAASTDSIDIAGVTQVYSGIYRIGGLICNNRSGSMKRDAAYVNVNGTWKRVAMIWQNVNGTWKRSY